MARNINQTGSAQIIRQSLVLAAPGLRLPWGGLLPDQARVAPAPGVITSTPSTPRHREQRAAQYREQRAAQESVQSVQSLQASD